MTEVRKRIGKAKIGLVTSTALVVILAISSVWLYTRVDDLQKQVDSIKIDKATLTDIVNNLLENEPVFQHMPDATLSQANPVSGTSYTVLDAVNNARIIGIAVKVTYSSTIPLVKCQITMDGVNMDAVKSDMENNTWYTVRISEPYADLLYSIGTHASRAFLLESRNVSIALGYSGVAEVTDLNARVKYAIMP